MAGRRSHAVLIVPDLHIPNHDQAALGCVLHALELVKPRRVVILGDFIDAESFSAHAVKSFAESRAYDFKKDELDPANALIDRFLKYSRKVVYVEGNHEARVERAAMSLGRIFSSVYPMVSPQSNLSLGRGARFKWIPHYGGFKTSHYRIAPKLIAVHGLSVAKHAAGQHLAKLPGYSVVYGHTHRRQLDSTRDPLSDEVQEAWSPGTLSLLQPIYMHANPSRWSHGFGLAYVRTDGRFTSYSIKIEHGEAVLPNGRVVRG